MHPAYQAIIGMGAPVIPFLLRELATVPDRWYWALCAITEEDPVPAKDRGNSEAMTRAWLEWAKARGSTGGGDMPEADYDHDFPRLSALGFLRASEPLPTTIASRLLLRMLQDGGGRAAEQTVLASCDSRVK